MHQHLLLILAADGAIRIYDAIVYIVGQALLKKPETITATNMRKYMATILQVNNLCSMTSVIGAT